jgi:hypothetical protein
VAVVLVLLLVSMVFPVKQLPEAAEVAQTDIRPLVSLPVLEEVV